MEIQELSSPSPRRLRAIRKPSPRAGTRVKHSVKQSDPVFEEYPNAAVRAPCDESQHPTTNCVKLLQANQFNSPLAHSSPLRSARRFFGGYIVSTYGLTDKDMGVAGRSGAPDRGILQPSKVSDKRWVQARKAATTKRRVVTSFNLPAQEYSAMMRAMKSPAENEGSRRSHLPRLAQPSAIEQIQKRRENSKAYGRVFEKIHTVLVKPSEYRAMALAVWVAKKWKRFVRKQQLKRLANMPTSPRERSETM